MHLKNSALLFTALTAGSAVARMHGHERRHAHHAEKRGLGDMVTATINGKIATWANEYAGGGGGGAAAATSTTESAATATETEVAATTTASSSESSSDDTPTASPVSSASGTCPDWHSTTDTSYSRAGFGAKTIANLLKYINYIGNIGNPWGSNIIQVDADKACQYKNLIKVEGSHKDPWTMVFWNKIGPDRKLTGWYGHSALTLNIQPGETKYVAFDDDSQGAWGAAKGETLPTDNYGGYSCTWGEFDFANSGNNDWSGWDVSAIQAQAAGHDVQGMKICTHENEKCSYITNLAKTMHNAYGKAQEGVDGIGGNQAPGPVRLLVSIDYEE